MAVFTRSVPSAGWLFSLRLEERKGVGQLLLFAGGQRDGEGLVLKTAGLVVQGGAAVPRLHAEEGAAGSPEGHHGELAEIQGHTPSGSLVPQGGGLGPESLEDKGV